MTLVFNDVKPVPQTHVMIIGVGGYPYLLGGTQEKPNQLSGIDGLGQLTSPPVSAAEFYSAVLDFHQSSSWTRSLGSVELLISNPPNTNAVLQGVQYEAPTLNNIRNAYHAWRSRCDSSPDNVAIFYFCGHGLEKGEHFLLAEDFGVDPNDPWFECFAFDTTRLAFHTCAAKTQCFFIDACRQLTASLLTHIVPVTPLQNPSLRTADCPYNLTVKASAMNEAAYGRKNEASFFTKALINGLKGDAAMLRDGEWQIMTSSISSNINELLQQVKPSEGYKQRCISTIGDTTQILKFVNPPQVEVNVYCNPDEALSFASLTCTNLKTKDVQSRPPMPDPWTVNLPAGIYRVEAQFNAAPYVNAHEHIHAVPPVYNQKIQCL